jgi:hypothetical protein
MEKLLLSEQAKKFMDYAVDMLSYCGAPDHNEQQKAEVLERISLLKEFHQDVEQSYLENSPVDTCAPVNP